MNDAYNMLALLRDQVGEASASHWSDVNLLRRLNVSQRKAALIVSSFPGAWLVKSAELTPVANVITLPADCSKPMYLEETASARPLNWMESVKTRAVSKRLASSISWTPAPEVYPLMRTLEVNESGYTTGVTLWYEGRVPDLMTGTASAGGAASLTFPDNANVRHIDDYYNGVSFQAEEGTGAGTVGDVITDYAGATGVCTVSGTYSTDTVFGTISLLPEEAIPFIIADATVGAVAKPSSNIDKEIFFYYRNERKEQRKVLEEWLETRIKGYSRVEITEGVV